jgi:small subunit ribosomal protein S9
MKKLDYFTGVGRRRTSIARVRLYRGKGENTVNGKPSKVYFEGAVSEKALLRPFGATETSDKYYFTAKVLGGGKNGQLEAVVLGISRALVSISSEKNRSPLKKLGLLTRDSRIRQRRMVGMGGKARRQKQSPKR